MAFREFKEFSDPLEKDYDLDNFLGEDNSPSNEKQVSSFTYELLELVGLLSEEELPYYNLTLKEYLSPTEQTIEKVKEAIKSHSDSDTKKR